MKAVLGVTVLAVCLSYIPFLAKHYRINMHEEPVHVHVHVDVDVGMDMW